MRLCIINEDVLKVLIFGAKNWSKMLKSDVPSSSNISTTITGMENLSTYLESWIKLEVYWGADFQYFHSFIPKNDVKVGQNTKKCDFGGNGYERRSKWEVLDWCNRGWEYIWGVSRDGGMWSISAYE